MIRSSARWRTWCAAAVAVILLGALSSPVPAEAPEDTAATLIQQTFGFIRDEALVPADPLYVLRQAVMATQQALLAAGVREAPDPPTLSGHEDDDLRATVEYVQAAVRSIAPRLPDALTAAALRAMVRAAGDSLGAVFPPPEFARFLQELRGEHSGIGVQIDLINGAIVVVDLTDAGPAMRAGVRPGDVVLQVDGQPVDGRAPDQVLDLLRGRAGAAVILRVRRDGEVRQFSITREPVRENPTRARMLDPRVGYLRLLEFSEHAGRDVERAMSRLTGLGAQALVLDLRENGGGLVDEAMVVASVFLPRGVVAVEATRGTSVTHLVRPATVRFAGPLVVLVNEATASASELVAGALQDAGVPLIGTQTYGKATVQTIFFLPSGWGLRLTTAVYRTRSGREIDGAGLTPDIAVATRADQIQGPGDLQLEAARLLVRRRLEATGRP